MRRRTAAQSVAINIRLLKRENETCRGRMCVLLPIHVSDRRLRNTNAAADMNRLALGSHGADFVVQCSAARFPLNALRYRPARSANVPRCSLSMIRQLVRLSIRIPGVRVLDMVASE